jgi:microsomal dipeptidase-like Zn-dependent dipeptidase
VSCGGIHSGSAVASVCRRRAWLTYNLKDIARKQSIDALRIPVNLTRQQQALAEVALTEAGVCSAREQRTARSEAASDAVEEFMGDSGNAMQNRPHRHARREDNLDYVIRIAGEDNVGIGTDFTQDQDDAFFEYLCLDKGYGWRVTGPLGEVVNPAGMRIIGDFPNLTSAMEHAGWPEAKIRKVMGENWLRLLAEVWVE